MTLEEEILIIVQWYKSIPEEYKRYVAFRHERVKDDSVKEIHDLFAIAEKISKAWKKHQKEKEYQKEKESS